MQPLDYLVCILYFVFVLAVGFKFKSQKNSLSSYCLADRKMHWFPIGLSIMVTSFSAVNYIAFPLEVYANGLYILICLPVFILVSYPVAKIFIPFYHKQNLTSIYEYFEVRFDERVKILMANLFILWKLLWIATFLYATGKILGAITQSSIYMWMTLVGLVAIVYTSFGGIKAVIWTDVAQFFILVGGIIFSLLFVLSSQKVSLDESIQVIFQQGKLKPFYPLDLTFFSFDPRIRITFWSGLIGCSVIFLTRYAADQVVVQRYFTAKNLKNAKYGFYWNILTAILALSLLAGLGVILILFSHQSNTHQLKPIQVFAGFIKFMPNGISGLLVAGLIAATMSSIDSGINSCLTVFINDLRGSDSQSTRWNSKYELSMAFGLTAIVLSFVVSKMGSVFVLMNKVIHGVGSPFLAIVFLAIYSKRVNCRGVFFGIIFGVLLSILNSLFVTQLALHYYALVNFLITALMCYGFSKVFQSN